jgi:hypothetical protein
VPGVEVPVAASAAEAAVAGVGDCAAEPATEATAPVTGARDFVTVETTGSTALAPWSAPLAAVGAVWTGAEVADDAGWLAGWSAGPAGDGAGGAGAGGADGAGPAGGWAGLAD